MTSLLQMVEHANEAGQPLPYIRMRNADNQVVDVFTQSAIRRILSAIAARKNRVESAHNAIIMRIAAQEAIRDDKTKPLADRQSASTAVLNILLNYRMELENEIAVYDHDKIPTELPQLKLVLRERLEAVALARTKWFKDVLTQQGVDLPDSCDDQANAGRAVAVALDAGNEAITEAEDATAAKAAYDTAVATINGTYPLNIPEFKIAGDALGANPPEQTVAGNSFTFRADHPGGSGVPGKVRIPSGRVRGFDGDTEIDVTFVPYARQEGETLGGGSVSVSAVTYAGKAIRVEIEARNRCGPSVLTVVMNVPPATP